MIIEAIILTKSSKNGGYCVAGIETSTGKWIRFVSNNEATAGAIDERDMRCSNGAICCPLDVVQVKVREARPSAYQPENFLIDDNCCWQHVGTASLQDVLYLHPCENEEFLYGTTDPYINECVIESLHRSLILVEVSNFTIWRSGFQERLRSKARFSYNGHLYNDISVTDPAFYNVPDFTHFNRAFLVVSLPGAGFSGELFEGMRFYKFVAKIFPAE